MTDSISAQSQDQTPVTLSDAELERAAGGVLGGDDDLDDLEVERLRARRR